MKRFLVVVSASFAVSGAVASGQPFVYSSAREIRATDVSAPAAQAVPFPSARYEGRFHSEATSYKGEKYSRHFDVRVDFFINGDIRGQARVRQADYCRDSDEPSLTCVKPGDFDPYCVTELALPLGSARVTIRETETGLVLTKEIPWKANVFRSEAKGSGACETSSLAGKPVTGEIRADFELPSVKRGTTRHVSLSIEPYVDSVGVDDLALASTLRAVGPDSYEATPFEARAKGPAWWGYIHEAADALTWGTSGMTTLVKSENP